MNKEYEELNVIEDFKKGDLYINCKTKEEIIKFIDWCMDNNIESFIAFDDIKYIMIELYKVYCDNKKKQICFSYDARNKFISFSALDNLKYCDIKIIEFEYVNNYYEKQKLDNVGFIGVKYLDKTMDKLEKTDNGDCIDLRVREITLYKNMVNDNINTVYDSETLKEHYLSYEAGDILFIKFGVILKVPYDKRINLYSRSSTFKKYGLILTNSVGIIDNSYCGNEDEICGMFYALHQGKISFNERIAQFEVVDRMICTNREIVELTNIENPSRGGYGTSGVN